MYMTHKILIFGITVSKNSQIHFIHFSISSFRVVFNIPKTTLINQMATFLQRRLLSNAVPLCPNLSEKLKLNEIIFKLIFLFFSQQCRINVLSDIMRCVGPHNYNHPMTHHQLIHRVDSTPRKCSWNWCQSPVLLTFSDITYTDMF